MEHIKQVYRSNYAGEKVVTKLTYRGGDWHPETEYIENSVTNTYTTGQAIAIGNGESRLLFDLTHIVNHRGGLFGANRLQTYGCNALYRDFTPDFLIASGDKIIEEISASGYCNDNIVYADGASILKHPGKFYLIPQGIQWDTGSLAAYMACFDGHKKIFLIGYDNYHFPGIMNNVYKNTNGYSSITDTQDGTFWTMSLHKIMSTYTDVEFIKVMPTASEWTPPEITALINFRQIGFRDFVLEADIG